MDCRNFLASHSASSTWDQAVMDTLQLAAN